MIKKYLAVTLATGFAASLFVALPAVANTITDQQIQLIRESCIDIQTTLNRIKTSDTGSRANRGDFYQQIAKKLMIPFNQRVASNQLDGSKLVAVTAKFNSKYDNFYDAYSDYAMALGEATQIDCSKRPTQFYDAVLRAHQERRQLHDADHEMAELIVDYKKQLVQFQKQLKDEN